jgi:hypothetical protein
MIANQENASIILNGDSTGDETTEWFYRLGAWIASKFPTHNVLYYDFPYAKQEFGQSKIIQVGINGLGYCVTGSGQYVRAASKAAYNITGDIEIAVKLQPTTLGATKYIAAKWGAAGNYSWYIAITSDNKIRFNRSSNGTITEYRDSTLAIPYAVNDVFWIKVCYDYDNGNNGNSTDFYTSADGITWTKLGTTVVVAGIGPIFAGTGDLQFHAANSSNSLVGKFYEAYIRNGIGGSLVASVNMSLANFTYLTAAYTFNDIMGNEFELVATSKTGANTLVMINCSASGMGTSYSMDQNRFDKFTAFSEPHLFFVSYGHNEVGEYATYNTLYSALIDKICLASINEM